MGKDSSSISRYILGQRVDYTTYNLAAGTILDMAQNGQQGYVCISTVHMVIEAYDDPSFQGVINGAVLIHGVWYAPGMGLKATRNQIS